MQGKKKVGRPKLKPHERAPVVPCRQLGRVTAEDWQLLQDAAAAADKSFTAWALDILTAAAERELGR